MAAVSAQKRKAASKRNQPYRRTATVRISQEAALRIADGHPWVFRDALSSRTPDASQGDGTFDIIDEQGQFVGRALLEAGTGPIALRVFSRRPRQSLNAAYLERALHAAAARRRSTLDLDPAGCFRLLSGDAEGVPGVCVDRYASHLLVIAYGEMVELFQAVLLEGLMRCWKPDGIYMQRRYTPVRAGEARPGAKLVAGEAAPPELVVSEQGLRYAVDVSAPLGTGLFADMRDGRALVARYASGKRVLNCFSYTGAFSAVAAVHGAQSVVSVDAASRAHSRARRNFVLNGLNADSPQMRFVRGDVFATLDKLSARSESFDLVIVDPPTFSSGSSGRRASSRASASGSRSKGGRRPFSALRDYAELTAAALKVTAPEGMLCMACNTTKLAQQEFFRALARGSRLARRSTHIVEQVNQPADYPIPPGFPEAAHLKCVLLQTD